MKVILQWSVAIVLLLIILSLHSKWKHKSLLKRMNKECLKSNQTIFVALIGNSTTAAKSLFHIFESSSCPKRIQVGLYEIIDDTDDALTQFKKLNEKNSSYSQPFETQVKVMKRLISDRGPYGAIKELMDHNLKDAQYTLVLSDECIMQPGWDANLIQILNNSRSCLVISPHENPSFTVLSSFEENMPVVGWKSLHEKSSTEAKFWTRQCSFNHSSFWRKMKWNSNLKLNQGCEVLITCDALSRGWKFMHPHSNIMTLQSSSLLFPNVSSKNIFESYFQQLLDLNMNEKFKNAALGIVNDKNENEVIIKYGSRAEYFYLANKL